MSRWQRQKLQGVAATVEREEELGKDYLIKTPWEKLSTEHQTSGCMERETSTSPLRIEVGVDRSSMAESLKV